MNMNLERKLLIIRAFFQNLQKCQKEIYLDDPLYREELYDEEANLLSGTLYTSGKDLRLNYCRILSISDDQKIKLNYEAYINYNTFLLKIYMNYKTPNHGFKELKELDDTIEIQVNTSDIKDELIDFFLYRPRNIAASIDGAEKASHLTEYLIKGLERWELL